MCELSLGHLKQNALDCCLNSGTQKNLGVSNKFKLDGRSKGVETSGEMAVDYWHYAANLFSQHHCRTIHVSNYMYTFLTILLRRVELDKTYKIDAEKVCLYFLFHLSLSIPGIIPLLPVPSLWSDI